MPIPLETTPQTGSTSDDLKRRADAGAGECALLARRQTGGHGRLGRSWATVDGNLFLSVLLRPRAPLRPGPWSLLAAVALAEALRPLLPPGTLRLKWPNDVLLRGAKLAGILLESGSDAAPWLVFGFGVNLAGTPAGLDRPTACLADLVPPPTPEAFAPSLLAALDIWRQRYEAEGPEPVLAAWLALGPAPGDPLIATAGPDRIAGTFRTLAPDGALLLDTPDGPRSVTSGEIG